MYGSYLLTFSVKAKIYSVKFQQAVKKILSLKFFIYFRHEISFPNSILKDPGKKVGRFSINKKSLHFN